MNDPIYMANRAKEVVENEAYIEAFAAIKQEIQDQWESAPARDTEGRERLWLMQSLLKKLKTTLEATISGGKLAAANLEYREKTLQERLKNDWRSSGGRDAA